MVIMVKWWVRDDDDDGGENGKITSIIIIVTISPFHHHHRHRLTISGWRHLWGERLLMWRLTARDNHSKCLNISHISLVRRWWWRRIWSCPRWLSWWRWPWRWWWCPWWSKNMRNKGLLAAGSEIWETLLLNVKNLPNSVCHHCLLSSQPIIIFTFVSSLILTGFVITVINITVDCPGGAGPLFRGCFRRHSEHWYVSLMMWQRLSKEGGDPKAILAPRQITLRPTLFLPSRLYLSLPYWGCNSLF